MAPQTGFITNRVGSGFTFPCRSSPRLPRRLMPCPSQWHYVQLSFPFSPSPFAGGYYGFCWLLAPACHRRPFGHKARSPQVRTRSFTAQSPHLRRLALDHKSFAVHCLLALAGAAFYAVRVPRLAASLRASFPRSVTLAQLRFTSLAVVYSREDFHLQDRAHAGRTM